MHKKPALKLQTTTLWYYPSQQHTDEPLGTPGFQGATPTYVIWNVLERYTRANDLVVDPFCGGGTTIDVARSMERRALGYDLQPQRKDIFRADARKLPLEDGKADFFFLDPPYSTHLDYSGGEDCIGELDAFAPGYFEAMDAVFAEIERCLKDRRYLAVYCSDTYKHKRGFVPIGARFFALLEKRFKPVDHVAVVRGNRKLENPSFHRAAAEENFFLRGFNHLLIFKKERNAAGPERESAGMERAAKPQAAEGRGSSANRAVNRAVDRGAARGSGGARTRAGERPAHNQSDRSAGERARDNRGRPARAEPGKPRPGKPGLGRPRSPGRDAGHTG